MALLRQLLAILVLSMLTYCFTFLFVLHKPLTVGSATQYFALKSDYLKRTAGSMRILVFAGSNGRFSHRCSVIEEQYQIPCVNLSMTAGSSLVWQFQHYAPDVSKGDLLYLPLEYKERDAEVEPGGVGEEAPYIVAYEHSAMWHFYNLHQDVEALFSFDLPFAISALAETMMQRAGMQRRFSIATMDQEGDERDHTLEKARSYRDYVFSMGKLPLDLTAYGQGANWNEEAQLIQLAQARGALVVGGLPTIPLDTPVPASVVQYLTDFFHSHGACFIALPNRSQYPRDDFYDSQYHLAEPYQIMHTQALAPSLVEIRSRGHCP